MEPSESDVDGGSAGSLNGSLDPCKLFLPPATFASPDKGLDIMRGEQLDDMRESCEAYIGR